MKTELLIQMEGCNPSGERRLLLVGATNRPEVGCCGVLRAVRAVSRVHLWSAPPGRVLNFI